MYGISLQGLVHDEFEPERGEPMTLLRVTAGDVKTGGITGRDTTTTEYPCTGYRVDYDSSRVDGEQILKNDCMLRVYPLSLPEGIRPSARDKVVHDGTTFSIVDRRWDQAKSMHVIQARAPAAP